MSFSDKADHYLILIKLTGRPLTQAVLTLLTTRFPKKKSDERKAYHSSLITFH